MSLPALHDPREQVACAVDLVRELPVEPGERLVTILGNSIETFAVGLACMLEGVVQVPLPADLAAAEVATIVGDAAPAAALIDPALARGTGGLGEVPTTTFDPGDLRRRSPAEVIATWPRTRPMAYTSGTTGRRKGVWVGLHDEIWGREVIADEHAAFDQRHGQRHLVVSPLYHSGPFRFAAVTALLGGEVAVLPRFDARLWLDTIRELRPTSMFCVPTHLHRLLALPDLTGDDLASFTLIAHAGAPCPEPLKQRLLAIAPEGAVWEFYGSTEGQFTACPPQVWQAAPGTVGRARAERTLTVRDGDGGILPAGEVGTVWVEVPAHARWEYWGAPERTGQAWDGDAFTVGDLGRLDAEGHLTLEGRPGDLVISGGVNVYPAEVERHLLTHPAVAEAVVFGVPDDEWGERVEAAVVPWDGQTVSGEELVAHCREQLGRAQTPKTVHVVDDLPRTETGKVLRVGLAAAVTGS